MALACESAEYHCGLVVTYAADPTAEKVAGDFLVHAEDCNGDCAGKWMPKEVRYR